MITVNPINELVSEIFKLGLWKKTTLLKKNDIIVEKQDISKEIFFIKSGALIISTEIEEKEQIIRLAYQNSLITTIDSFLMHKPTIYQIKSIRESEVIIADKESLEIIFSENPEMYNALLVELIHQQNEREVDLLHTSANKRFERLLLRSPQVFQEIPHKYIASYLRISPETLSRLLKS